MGECGGARKGVVVEVEGNKKIFQTLGKSGSMFPRLLSGGSNRSISAMAIDFERTRAVGFLCLFIYLLLLCLLSIILRTNWEQGEDSQVP